MKQSVIDSGLTAERRIRGLEYMPGDRRVVRAVFFTVQETGQWIGSWTPWYGFTEAPANTAYRLPAGAHLIAEIYYRSAKERVVERGTVGLFFAEKPAPSTLSDLVLDAKATNRADRFRAEVTLPADTHAAALRIEPAPGVKSVEISERRADGTTQVLLFAKDIPADWPTPYILKDPVLLRRGSVLSVTAYSGTVKATISRF
jgi:hypothetical protein